MIALTERARDRLAHQLCLWREEVRVHGPNGTGQSTMTQGDIDELERRIVALHQSIEALNRDYQRIVEM